MFCDTDNDNDDKKNSDNTVPKLCSINETLSQYNVQREQHRRWSHELTMRIGSERSWKGFCSPLFHSGKIMPRIPICERASWNTSIHQNRYHGSRSYHETSRIPTIKNHAIDLFPLPSPKVGGNELFPLQFTGRFPSPYFVPASREASFLGAPVVFLVSSTRLQVSFFILFHSSMLFWIFLASFSVHQSWKLKSICIL